MKKYYLTAIAAAVLLATPLARAWNYTDGDSLLIFRKNNFNTIEFNLGNVSQFTNVPAGTTIPVTGWSSSLVTGTYGSDLTGVSVIVLATQSPYGSTKASWVSGQVAGGTVNEPLTTSAWQSKYWSTINSVGIKPIQNTATPTPPNAYSIDPSSASTQGASYDYIVTGNGTRTSQIVFLGGNAAFNVEGLVPSSFAFWQVAPGPNATYTGTFNITADGVLTYTAGPYAVVTPPTIVGVTRAADVSTVSFSTANGGSYYLTFANTLTGSSTNWPVVSGPVTGNGGNQSLTHTNSADSAGFYRVYRTP